MENSIGIGNTAAQDRRVDLLDGGLSPVVFSDILKLVEKQAGGDWPETASDLLLSVATILEAADFTEAGERCIEKHYMRMYSLLNILRVASSDAEIETALQIVASAMQDKNDEYRAIAHLDKPSLYSALDYLVGSWLPMGDETKDGIRVNARKALRMFVFEDETSQGCANGSSEDLMQMGRGRALVFVQRAGGTRVEIIKLPNN